MNEYPLQYSLHYPEIITKLIATPRTGWVQWGIENPENVWEHIVDTRKLAISYKDSFGLSEADLIDVLAIIEIHDWSEALVGDLVVMGDEENVEELRRDKKQKESDAMQSICQGQPLGEEILSLYKRYENNEDKNAKLAKQLDKFQAVLKAVQYETVYNKPGLAAEFVNYSKDYFEHPVLKAEYDQVALNILE
jgi:putative hydrolase of HD superfamily